MVSTAQMSFRECYPEVLGLVQLNRYWIIQYRYLVKPCRRCGNGPIRFSNIASAFTAVWSVSRFFFLKKKKSIGPLRLFEVGLHAEIYIGGEYSTLGVSDEVVGQLIN
jgi:hypothetical protein